MPILFPSLVHIHPQIGMYLSSYGLINVLFGRTVVNWLIAKAGTLRALQVAKLASLLGTGGLGGALAPSTPFMYGLFCLNPLSEAESPTLKTLMASEAKHIGKGTLAAMLSNLEAAFAIAMPLVIGRIFTFFLSPPKGLEMFRTPSATFYLCAATHLASLAITTRLAVARLFARPGHTICLPSNR